MIREIAARPVPQWLASAGEPLPELPVRDVLAGSVYYPASGFDGDPVKFIGGNFHSFVYVDYGIGREQLLENLDAFRGYRVASYREVTERELTPNGWRPVPPQSGEGSSRIPDGRIKPPFGVWSIHEPAQLIRTLIGGAATNVDSDKAGCQLVVQPFKAIVAKVSRSGLVHPVCSALNSRTLPY